MEPERRSKRDPVSDPVLPERPVRPESGLIRGREFPAGLALAGFVLAEAVCFRPSKSSQCVGRALRRLVVQRSGSHVA